MRISELIEKYIPDEAFQTINETEVDSFGFLNCKKERVCSYAGSPKFVKRIQKNIKMLIVSEDLVDLITNAGVGMIVVEDPQKVFWQLHQRMNKDYGYVREQKSNRISQNAIIGECVSIADHNVIIEDNVVIEDFVTIYQNTHIKRGSIIRSGSRIGGVGLQEYKHNSVIETINHYGGVTIGENVDIQNNVCIDRALFPWEDTIIGDECKLDNFVHVAHATTIGKRCEFAAGAIIAGRCVIGDDVWIGLGALVRNFVEVGNNSRLNIGSVVVNNVDDNCSVSGNFAIDHNRFLYSQLRLSKLK